MKNPSLALIAALLIATPVIADEKPAAPDKPVAEKPTSDAPVAEKPALPVAPVTPAPDRDANGVYQVFRGTDNQLNCDQLIAEMNNLNAVIKSKADQQAQAQAQAQQGGGAARKVGGSVLGGALGGFARSSIARSVPGLGYVGAVTAISATDAASNAVGNAVANGGGKAAPAAPASASDESQRLSRVSGLFTAKGC